MHTHTHTHTYIYTHRAHLATTSRVEAPLAVHFPVFPLAYVPWSVSGQTITVPVAFIVQKLSLCTWACARVRMSIMLFKHLVKPHWSNRTGQTALCQACCTLCARVVFRCLTCDEFRRVARGSVYMHWLVCLPNQSLGIQIHWILYAHQPFAAEYFGKVRFVCACAHACIAT
jgi:hypothetical protein